MWKSSASSVVGGRFSSNVGERSGSFRQETNNGRSSVIGQSEQDSVRQLWETAMDGVESSAWEDINEELFSPSRPSNASNRNSFSSSSSPIARQGGKFLEVVKRKVNLSSGTRKTSPKVQDAKDSNSRNSRTPHGEILSDKLLEELKNLRRKLEKKEKEMQKLKNEMSTWRITTAIKSVQPQSQSQAEADSQEGMGRSDSVDSDSSLSCLDFSLAPSTGNLMFEGKIKTKITHDSKIQAGSRDQADSILSDSEAVGAPRLSVKLSPVNEDFALEEVRSTTKGSVPSQMPERDIGDKHVEANKKSLDECKVKICQPESAASFCHDHTGGGLEFPVKAVKEELYISTQTYVYKPEDEFFHVTANASRSPPQSTSSTDEQDDFGLPIMFLGANNSFNQETATLSKVADCVLAGRSSCDLSDVEVDEISRLKMMKDGEELDVNALTAPLNNQTNYTTSNSSPAEEDPLKLLMKSCVLLEVDKLSKTVTSSKYPDLITGSIPVVSPRRRKVQPLITATHSDPISRSTSVLSPPRSRPAAAQSCPNRGVLVSGQPLDSEVNAVDSGEHPETVEPLSNGIPMGSKLLTISTSEGSTESMTGSHGLDFDHLPPPESYRRSSFGSKGPQSLEYAKTTADRHEVLLPVLPSTSPRATRTAGRHERPLPISPSASPRGRGLPTPSYSAGSQLLFEETGWKPKSGTLEEIDLEEEVRQILEQSRLLLMSGESGNVDEPNVRGPESRDKPFSVLALSRHRRSIVKNRSSFRHSPEMNQQQEREEQQEERSIVLYGDDAALDIQWSKADDSPGLDGEQENDDHSLSRPRTLRSVVGAPCKKVDLQLVWELEVQNSKNQILSSLPRRSRFFFEANTATTPEVM